MTQGKNPRTFKKKGAKKRQQHPFSKKVWYTVQAPSAFQTREATLTPVNKTSGRKKENTALKGRVFDLSLGDLNPDAPEMAWRKIQLEVAGVEGQKAYTLFHGMSMTRDRLCHIVKKWQTTIEAFVNVKTRDNFLLRVFVIGFTSRRKTQLKATSYATNCQIGKIRKKMREIMIEEIGGSLLKQVSHKFVERVIEKRIGKECNKIFPLQNVYIKRCKMLKQPKLPFAKLMDMYSDKAGAARAD